MRRLQLQLQVSKRVWPWVTARLQSPPQRWFLFRLQTLIQLLSLTRKSSMTWWKLPKASSANERWGIALGSKTRCEELCFRGPSHSDFIGKGLVCGLSQSSNVWATTVICVDCLMGLHSINLFGRWFCWWGIGGCLYTLTCHLHWPLKLATFQKSEAKIDTPWLAGLAFIARKLFGTWVMLLHGDVQTNEICSNSGASSRCHALWKLQGQTMSPFLELRSSFPAMGPACKIRKRHII